MARPLSLSQQLAASRKEYDDLVAEKEKLEEQLRKRGLEIHNLRELLDKYDARLSSVANNDTLHTVLSAMEYTLTMTWPEIAPGMFSEARTDGTYCRKMPYSDLPEAMRSIMYFRQYVAHMQDVILEQRTWLARKK